jgi:hypothetical protein
MIAHDNVTCCGLWVFRGGPAGSETMTPVQLVRAALNLYDCAVNSSEDCFYQGKDACKNGGNNFDVLSTYDADTRRDMNDDASTEQQS